MKRHNISIKLSSGELGGKYFYGCVSTGTNWKFLKLTTTRFYIDTIEYYIQNPEKIMAILAAIAKRTSS